MYSKLFAVALCAAGLIGLSACDNKANEEAVPLRLASNVQPSTAVNHENPMGPVSSPATLSTNGVAAPVASAENTAANHEVAPSSPAPAEPNGIPNTTTPNSNVVSSSVVVPEQDASNANEPASNGATVSSNLAANAPVTTDASVVGEAPSAVVVNPAALSSKGMV